MYYNVLKMNNNNNRVWGVRTLSPYLFLNSAFDLCNTTDSEVFIDMYPENYLFPKAVLTGTEKRSSWRHSAYAFLPDVSGITNLNVFLKVTACSVHHKSIEYVDRFLMYGKPCIVRSFDDCELIDPLLDEFKNKTRTILHYFDDYEDLPSYNFDHLWKGNYHLMTYQIPKIFTCKCKNFGHELADNFIVKDWNRNVETFQDSDIEATSFVQGIKHLSLSIWEFLSPSQHQSVEQVCEKWALEFLDLMLHFSITKILTTFLKIIVSEFMPLSELMGIAAEYIQYALSYLSKCSLASSTQVDAGEDVEATSFRDSLDISKLDIDLPAVAAAVSSLAVVFASCVVGFNVVTSKSSKCMTEKLADGFACIGKGKNGLYAMLEMMKDFAKYVKTTVFDFIVDSEDTGLFPLVRACKVMESSNFEKNRFFEYIKFLLDPSNLILIQQNEVYQMQLENCYKIFEEISERLGNDDIQITAQAREFVRTQQTELRKVRHVVMRRPKVDSVRFTPWWINIIGDSGTGKSVFTPLLVDYIYEALSKLDEDFALPSKDKWFYPVNFSDRYLTNYIGNYVVTIDDFLQDNKPLGDTSSALNIINWISSIPYYTNQAAIDDKGIPFTSKIIITTSNDFNMDRDEVKSKEALTRRMRMCVTFKDRDENGKPLTNLKPDPLLGGKKVKISLVDWQNTNNIIKTYENAQELIKECIKSYIEWYRKELIIMKSRKITPNILDEIVDQISVEATSSFRCTIGLRPKIYLHQETDRWLIEQYQCDCDYHVDINREYNAYCAIQLLNLSIPSTLINFEKQKQYNESYFKSFIDKTQCIIDVCKNKAQQAYRTPACKLILSFIALGALYFGGKSLNKMIDSKPDLLVDEDDEVEITQAKYQMSKPARKPAKQVLIEATSGDKIEPMVSNYANKQAYDLIYEQLVRKSAVCKVVHIKNNQATRNCALRIGGTLLLTNHHFYHAMQEGDEFTILLNNQNSGMQRIKQLYNPDKAYRIPGADIVIYACDRSLPQSKNIIKHFPNNSLLSTHQQCMVVTAEPEITVSNNIIATPLIVQKSYTFEGEQYSILDSYQTNCPVRRGMSGSVMIGASNSLQHRILGIQTSRNTKTEMGYFKPGHGQ